MSHSQCVNGHKDVGRVLDSEILDVSALHASEFSSGWCPATRLEVVRICQTLLLLHTSCKVALCSALSRTLNRNASVATPAECRRGLHEFLEISDSVAGIAVAHQDSSIKTAVCGVCYMPANETEEATGVDW